MDWARRLRDPQTVLITGSTAGIGAATAHGLTSLGFTTLLVGRDRARAETAAARLRRDTGNPRVVPLVGDISLGSGVSQLAAQVADHVERLDVLINNAAANPPRRRLTAEGVELTFATNVLAPFRLGRELLPLLRGGGGGGDGSGAIHDGDRDGNGNGNGNGNGDGDRVRHGGGGEGNGHDGSSGGGRIVNLTGGIPKGRIDPDNLQAEKRFTGFTFSQYNHSKLAVMAMSLVLARRAARDGVTVNVAYPGHASTPGNRGLPMSAFPVLYRPAAPLLRLLGPRLLGERSVARASRSSVYLASDDELAGVTGRYYDSRCRVAAWPSSVLDPANQDAVWRLCERLAGATESRRKTG